MTEYGDRYRNERYRDEGYGEAEEGAERRTFLQRLFFGDGEEDAGYSTGSTSARELEESEEPRELHGFTVERAASVIKDMPDDVPQKSAVRIVRQTLAAAGIEVNELDRATRMRESKLESRIELGRGRVDELNEKTDEVITSLQDQIEKAREARDYGVSEEERKIDEARDGLSDVDLVRGFFDIEVEEPRSEASSDQIADDVEPREFWSERYQDGELYEDDERYEDDEDDERYESYGGREEYREDETQILDPVEDDTQVFDKLDDLDDHDDQDLRGPRRPQYGGDEDEPRGYRS